MAVNGSEESADGLEFKLKILQRSGESLSLWLDQCEESVGVHIPLEDFMEADPNHLMQLALHYKDLLLKLKERYSVLQEMKGLLKEVNEENMGSGPSNRLTSLECSKLSKQVTTMHTKWSSICQQVKQLYSKLSIALASVSGRSPSPVSPTSKENGNGHSTSTKLDSIINKSSNNRLSPQQHQHSHSATSLPSPRASPTFRLNSYQSHPLSRPPPGSPQRPMSSGPHTRPVPARSRSMNESLDDLLDALKEEAENHISSHSSKAPASNAGSFPVGVSTPPPPPKPARSKSQPQPQQQQKRFSNSSLEKTPLCRLSVKLEEMSLQVDGAEESIVRGVACFLDSKEIEGRLKEMRGSLTLLDLQSEELKQLCREAGSIPSSPSPTRPSKVSSIASSYTLLELACCKTSLSKLYHTVTELQSVCNNQICNMEVVLELVEEFEENVGKCKGLVASYEKAVSGLRVSSLEGNLQLWTAANRSLETLSLCEESFKSMLSFSQKLKSLEPHFDGTPVHQRVQEAETRLRGSQSEGEGIILGAVGHREAYTREVLAILSNWLSRSEEEMKRIRRERRGVTHDFKKSKGQEVIDHLSSLQQITEQLECILKLSTGSLLHIPQLESIKESQREIVNKREKLASLSADIDKLPLKEELELHQRGPLKPYEEPQMPPPPVQNKRHQHKPLYAEVETKPVPNYHPLPAPGPVYSEILVKSKRRMTDMESPPHHHHHHHHHVPLSPPGQVPSSPPPPLPQLTRSIHMPSPETQQLASPSNSPPPASTTEGYQLPGKPLGKPKVLRHKLPDEYASPVKPVKPETKRESKKTGREDKTGGLISPPTHDHLDYDIPRPSSLRLVLLEFIDEEYSAMSDMIKDTSGFQSSTLRDTILALPDHNTAKRDCENFLRQLNEHHISLEGIMQQILHLDVPAVNPNPTLYQDQKRLCYGIHTRLEEIGEHISQLNETTNHLYNSLSSSSSQQEDTASALLLQFESELFEVSILHHRCWTKLQEKLKLLKNLEKDVTSLQESIESLSALLMSAQGLIARREGIMNVQDYLEECKDMHHKLAQQSSLRQEAATKIRDIILSTTTAASPSSSSSSSSSSPTPSEYSLKLLDQLKSIETQWVNAINDLMNMRQLEPVLIKQMIQNIAKELKVLEAAFPELEYGGIDLETIKKTQGLCQDKLRSCRELDRAVKAMKKRVDFLQSVEGNEHTYDHPRTVTHPLSPTSPPSPSSSHAISLETETRSSDPPDSILPKRRGSSVGTMHCDMVVDYEKAVKTAGLLVGLVERIIGRLESKHFLLCERGRILEQFWSESSLLSEWLVRTRLEVKGKKGLSDNNQSLIEAVTVKRQSFASLQELAKTILEIPSSSHSDKESVKSRSEKMAKEWQLLFRSLPLSVQVTLQSFDDDPRAHLKPPEKFEDINHMIEWLILVESKMQPHPLTVGDTTKLKKELEDINSLQKELSNKFPEYHLFMKSSRHSDHSDSSGGSSPTQLRGDSPPKTVKFVDENTIERQHRRKQIEQDNILETIISEDELEVTETRRDESGPPAIVSPTLEEAQQLSMIWTGVCSTLKQRKQALESVLDIWSGFESKKIACEKFLDKSELVLVDMYAGVKKAMSIEALQREMTELKALSEEATLYQHKMGTLNDLTTDLIQRHRSTDSIESLQESMTTLNVRWKKVNECFLRNKSAIEQVTTGWASFYQQYHPLAEFVRQLETELANINPHIKDMLTITRTVERLKFTQKELVARSGSLGVVKQYNVKLQEVLCRHITELPVVGDDIEATSKKWKTLTMLVEEKYQSLEHDFSERRDILSMLTRCETWTRRADEYLKGRSQLVADLSHIRILLDKQKTFEMELKERQNQLSMAVARARHMTGNFASPSNLTEDMNAEELKQYLSRLESGLEEIGRLLGKWKEEMNTVLGAMDEFQLLSTQFSQGMTEIQSGVPERLQPSATLPQLKQEFEHWQKMEANANGLGRVLEAMVASQKKMMGIGVQLNTDAVQLVKKYHTEWNNLRKTIGNIVDTVKKSMWKYDPKNVTTNLPRGWIKTKTSQGTPYYIDTLSGNHAQWQHPELSELYRSFSSRFQYSFYPSPAYPISLRLRCIQKHIQFEGLPTQVALDAFDYYSLKQDPHTNLSSSEMTEISLSLFHKASSLSAGALGGGMESDEFGGLGSLPSGAVLDVNRAVELAVSWIHDVFDLAHTGFVNALSFQVAIICLSSTKMDEKHKALFHIMSRGRTTVDRVGFLSFLETLVQIPQSMSDTQYCSLDNLEAHVNDCFRKYATGTQLHSVGYIAWSQAEPLPIAWLPILHRMAAAETMEHGIKCSVCRLPSIIGFRYKCLQCTNFNMCQECYWSGKTAKDHDRSKHFMEEYCISPDERGNFFRTLGNRGKKRSTQRKPDVSSLTNSLDTTSHLKPSLPDYHSYSLKREVSPSMNSLNTTSSSSVGMLERRGSLTNLSSSVDSAPCSLSQSHDISALPFLDDAQKIRKLRHHLAVGGGDGGLPVSHSFDFGRGTSVDESAPPLPPRNIIKKRVGKPPESSPTVSSPVSSMSSSLSSPSRSPTHSRGGLHYVANKQQFDQQLRSLKQ